MPEPDLIELFVARFGEVGAHYLVTGSVAATLYGEPRATHDIDLVGADDLHSWAFRNARRYSAGGVEVHVAPPECVITRKLELYREGGSPKHLRDIRSMLAISSELIVLAALEDWVRDEGCNASGRRCPAPESRRLEIRLRVLDIRPR